MTKKETKQKFIFSLIQSLFIELSLHPKPGLVTPLNTNSHSDMDFYLMLDSTKILFEYFNKLYEFTESTFSKFISKSNPLIDLTKTSITNGKNYQLNNLSKTFIKNKENYHLYRKDNIITKNKEYIYNSRTLKNIDVIFFLNIFIKYYIEKYYQQFIKIGKKYENTILSSTNGVNTYKGILFSYSILIIGFILLTNFKNFGKKYYKNFENLNNFKLIFNKKMEDFKKLHLLLKIVGKIIIELKIKYKDIANKSYGNNLRNSKIKGEIFTIAKSGYKICFETYRLLKLNLAIAETLFKREMVSNQLFFSIQKMIYLKAFCYIGSSIKDSNIAGKKGLKYNKKFNYLCKNLINSSSIFNFSKIINIKNKLNDNIMYNTYLKKILSTVDNKNNLNIKINNEIIYFFNEIEKINSFLIKEKLSPGGTADLLSFSIALYLNFK